MIEPSMPPPPSPSTAHAHREIKPRKALKTGSARYERRLEVFAPHNHRPLDRNSSEAGGLPVSNPKENFSNCLPCPAKRVSAHSVVKILDAPPHPPRETSTSRSERRERRDQPHDSAPGRLSPRMSRIFTDYTPSLLSFSHSNILNLLFKHSEHSSIPNIRAILSVIGNCEAPPQSLRAPRISSPSVFRAAG